jgi:hypothetical protein
VRDVDELVQQIHAIFAGKPWSFTKEQIDKLTLAQCVDLYKAKPVVGKGKKKVEFSERTCAFCAVKLQVPKGGQLKCQCGNMLEGEAKPEDKNAGGRA